MYVLALYFFLPAIQTIVITEIHRSAICHPTTSCAFVRNASWSIIVSIQSCIWECVYDISCQTAVYYDDEQICSMFTEFCQSKAIQSSGSVRASVICYRKTPEPKATCSSTVLTNQVESQTISTKIRSSVLLTAMMTSHTSTATTDDTTSTKSTSITSTTVTSVATIISTCADWRWNTTGDIVAGSSTILGSATNQLNNPGNIYLDERNDTLYIADTSNHRIQKWVLGASSATTTAGVAGISGANATLLNEPRDVFVDASQNIYVVDSGNNRVQFYPTGNSTGVTLSFNWLTYPGSLWTIQVVNQSIYMCDKSGSTIWKNESAVAGNQGSGTNGIQLSNPQSFTVDTSIVPGTIYVANSDQHTIVKWPINATTGTVVAGTDGARGNTSTLLNIPIAVKRDAYGNIFVVDNNNHRVQLFCQHPTLNMTGRTIAGTGSLGSSLQELYYPTGLALDSSLNLYVSDTCNHRVLKFRRLL